MQPFTQRESKLWNHYSTTSGMGPKVAGLVYIAAHAPDEGETETGDAKRFPNSARPLVKTSDGFVFLNPGHFPEDLAADLPRDRAQFMADELMLTAARVFSTPITRPAWKVKPSWYLVAKADKMINPDLERMDAERAHSHKVKIEGASHEACVSHPQEVAELIDEAAKTLSKL